MKKALLLGAAIIGSQLSGCATQSSNHFQDFLAEDLNAQIKAGQLTQKTHSFLVLNDSSSSMSAEYLNAASFKGTKLDAEKNLLNKFNKTIPDLPLNSGLRSFGFGPCTDWSNSVLKQAIQPYNQTQFQSAITALQCSSGGTPLADTVAISAGDLKQASGNIALLVFSDGEDETSPLPAAEALKAQFGDRLCIYTVWVGNDSDHKGKANLEQLAETGACGFATSAKDIESAQGMHDFVKNVFLKPAPVALDDDQDGVENAKDKCPDTPKGAIVDKDGCWAIHGVLFEFDSSRIEKKFAPLLDNAIQVMKTNPGLVIEIQGHTDSYGSDAYNRKLSQRRAQAVKEVLIKNGIDKKRMTATGFGESQPIDTNDTVEGRANNRRVVYYKIR